MDYSNNIFCPSCNKPLNEAYPVNNYVICSCGCSIPRHKSQNKANIDNAKKMAIAAFIFILAGIHFMKWGKHSFSILPVQVASAIGFSSVEDLEAHKAICQDLNKHDCTEDILQAIYKKNQDIEVLAELGKLNYKLERFAKANAYYKDYFAKGGKDNDAHFIAGKNAVEIEDFTQAEEHFLAMINARPNIKQITVFRHYVSMLMKWPKYAKAKKFILSKRRLGVNAEHMMDYELDLINKELKATQQASVN